MQIKATFKEIDWQGKLIKKVRTYNYENFDVSVDVLMKASIAGTATALPTPHFFDESLVRSQFFTPKAFLISSVGIDNDRFWSIVNAYADFKGWRLVLWDKRVEKTNKMRWEDLA